MRLPFVVLVLMSWLAIAPAAPAAAPGPDQDDHFDPAVLDALPDNTWVKLGLPWRGGHEVPAAFDAANGLLFKFGGCGDHSPRVGVEGSPRPNETYGNSCWAVNMRTGRWEMRRPRDVSFPADRPANGCSRCYAYDPSRRVVWMYGGISNGGGGGDQWDLWTYDAKADTFKEWHTQDRPPGGDGPNVANVGGDTFVYDPLHDLLIMPRGKKTWVFDPKTNRWRARDTPDGPAGPGHYASMVFDAGAGVLVYPVAERTGRSTQVGERPPATPRTFWRKHRDTYYECRFVTWTYDPAANQWAKLPVADDAPQPAPRWRFGLAYDSKNRVVILTAGSTDTWDEDEAYFNDVWVLDTKRAAWTKMQPAGPKPDVHHRDCRHCDYDPEHNVVLFMAPYGSLWAYRYKR